MAIPKWLEHLVPLFVLILVFVILISSGVELSGQIYLFVVVGFAAQLIDGALGMGFGMVSTATMLGFGIHPATISSSVHTAEVFACAASGLSHKRNGNINKKLFLSLLIPGVIGSIIGASLLVLASSYNTDLIRFIIASYTTLLGLRLIFLYIKKRKKGHIAEIKTNTGVRALAATGGFLDSFGGGGWGPVVTTTLINNGHHAPRHVIGSVNAAECFIALASAVTFFIALGLGHWQIVLALISGGVVAAPLAAKITSKVKSSLLLLFVGCLVIIWSAYSIFKLLS